MSADHSSADLSGRFEEPLEDDQLILVDDADRELGHLNKTDCHRGGGILHRAFSLFIFNGEGELLLQRRSESKRLWPLYWSNSCCSHPRRGESMHAAIHRRLYEELGLRCPLHYLFKFRYQAQFEPNAAEHELCSVFFGLGEGPVRANRREIAAWRWIGAAELDQELSDGGSGHFTPWFLLEWARIGAHHLDDIVSQQGLQAWAYR